MTLAPIDSLPVDKTIINFIKNQKDITIDKYSQKGGNGELFFGVNNILKRRVALKFYYIANSETPHEEARILSNIQDKNILDVLDAKIISKDYAYFLTPEITGGDLEKIIREKNIEIYRAIKITRGILHGLTTLHCQPYRLAHRDLKPGNILIDRDYNPFIADFGSIKKILPAEQSVKASGHTILYRPPESFRDESYNFQSDIYQVGIILFQLLGGYFPYQDIAWLNKKEKKKYSSFMDSYDKSKYFDKIIGRRICGGKLLDYSKLPFFICTKLKRIIKKATNVNLQERYQTTSEFLRDIHEFMGHAVNWCVDPKTIIAIKPNVFKFRIIFEDAKIKIQKKYGKVWRGYNKIKGSLKDISRQINLLDK